MIRFDLHLFPSSHASSGPLRLIIQLPHLFH
jgi:hypothetical protein